MTVACVKAISQKHRKKQAYQQNFEFLIFTAVLQ
jgi:hypothetical protein